jgi:hypothetical protein
VCRLMGLGSKGKREEGEWLEGWLIRFGGRLEVLRRIMVVYLRSGEAY